MTLVERFGILSAATLFLVTLVSSAVADNLELKVCNKTDEDIYLSVAGFDKESPKFQWRSKGWWKVTAEECRDFSFSTFVTRHLFIFANGGGKVWTGDFLFCVHTKNAFDLKSAKNCGGYGEDYAAKRFFHRTSPVGVYTVNLTLRR